MVSSVWSVQAADVVCNPRLSITCPGISTSKSFFTAEEDPPPLRAVLCFLAAAAFTMSMLAPGDMFKGVVGGVNGRRVSERVGLERKQEQDGGERRDTRPHPQRYRSIPAIRYPHHAYTRPGSHSTPPVQEHK